MKKIILSMVGLFAIGVLSYKIINNNVTKDNILSSGVCESKEFYKYATDKQKKLIKEFKKDNTGLLLQNEASLICSKSIMNSDRTDDCVGFCFCEIAAKNNMTGAIVTLAESYELGTCVTKDLEKALKLYKKAVKIDDMPYALFKLAILNEKIHNTKKAIYWYERLLNTNNSKKFLFIKEINFAKSRLMILKNSSSILGVVEDVLKQNNIDYIDIELKNINTFQIKQSTLYEIMISGTYLYLGQKEKFNALIQYIKNRDPDRNGLILESPGYEYRNGVIYTSGGSVYTYDKWRRFSN